MRILLVEDDPGLSSVLIRSLREESYAVDHASDGQEGEWLAFENPYDLIILDIMLPRKSGTEVLAELRNSGNQTPVLMLTAKDTKHDIVSGLDQGADDYMTKPFSVDELFARIRSLLRRPSQVDAPVLEAGPIKINSAKREVAVHGNPLELTTKEYALLEYFVRNRGTVVSRIQLSEHVWDQNFEPTSNVVDVYIGYLRTKLKKVIKGNVLKTIRGHGYILDIDAAGGLQGNDDSENMENSPQGAQATR